uniref:Uncharacterized protein n=1 Tax=Anas platyrhynchos platyrhynchos TaxID=8840 RepID=A0A493SX20_ANAPP
ARFSFQIQLILRTSKEPDQMGVSFLSLLGDGLTCCSLLAFETPPRFSASSSSCTCCSDFARCSSRSCTRSSMMASRSS